MPRVNPEILVWARKTAGLDLAKAAKKVNLRAARGQSPEARLAALEDGTANPTRALLTRMAKQYRRPLVAFYLDGPPSKSDRGQDFRTTAIREDLREEPLLDALIRDVLARQSLIKAALEAEDEVEIVDFVGGSDVRMGVDRIAADAIRILGFERATYRATRNLSEAFTYLRSCAESAGVFVLLIGDLGSHHTAISEDVFRGYALADRIAPFIIINDRDARAAWPFTLLHEFCHLLLGQTGISDVYGASRVEKFCNDVASRVLVDDAEIRKVGGVVRNGPTAARSNAISEFAKRANVSRTLAAYRLLKLGYLDPRGFQALRVAFYEEWRANRERERLRHKEREGGPSYYVVRRHRIGDGLMGTVSYLLHSGALTTSRAARVLGVKPKNVAQLLSGATGVV